MVAIGPLIESNRAIKKLEERTYALPSATLCAVPSSTNSRCGEVSALTEKIRMTPKIDFRRGMQRGRRSLSPCQAQWETPGRRPESAFNIAWLALHQFRRFCLLSTWGFAETHKCALA